MRYLQPKTANDYSAIPNAVSNNVTEWMNRLETHDHRCTLAIHKSQLTEIHCLQVRLRHAQPVHRPVKR